MSRRKLPCIFCQIALAASYSDAASSAGKHKYWSSIELRWTKELLRKSTVEATNPCSAEHRALIIQYRHAYRLINTAEYKRRLESMLSAFRKKLEQEKHYLYLKNTKKLDLASLPLRIAKAEVHQANILFSQRRRRLAESLPKHDEMKRLMERQLDALARIALDAYNKNTPKLDTAPPNA